MKFKMFYCSDIETLLKKSNAPDNSCVGHFAQCGSWVPLAESPDDPDSGSVSGSVSVSVSAHALRWPSTHQPRHFPAAPAPPCSQSSILWPLEASGPWEGRQENVNLPIAALTRLEE